jgi:hypothetical protein
MAGQEPAAELPAQHAALLARLDAAGKALSPPAARRLRAQLCEVREQMLYLARHASSEALSPPEGGDKPEGRRTAPAPGAASLGEGGDASHSAQRGEEGGARARGRGHRVAAVQKPRADAAARWC